MLLSSLFLLRRPLFSDASAGDSATPEAGTQAVVLPDMDPPEVALPDVSARVERIVRQHLDSIWRTARNLGVPDRDVDDVVQEVMLVVLRRLGDIDAERERAFVLGATARVAANWRRGRRRRPEELTESMDSVSGVHEVPAGRCAFRGPEQALERAEKLALLAQALSEMPEPLRVAFTLFELEQLTAREVAEQLGVPASAVFSRVRRAWVIFRRCCEQAGATLLADGPEAGDD